MFVTLSVSAEVWGASIEINYGSSTTGWTIKDKGWSTKYWGLCNKTAYCIISPNFDDLSVITSVKVTTRTYGNTSNNSNKIGVYANATRIGTQQSATATFTEYTFTPNDLSGNGAITIQSDGTATGAGLRVTKVTIEYNDSPKDPYTITYEASLGNPDKTSEETTSSVTLPNISSIDCGDWEFAGWATASIEETNETPNPLYVAGSTYTPSSDITLYAVYQRAEGGGGGGSVETTKVFSGANNADLKFTTGSSSNHLVNNTGYTAGDANVKFTTGTNDNNSYYDGSVVRFYAGSSMIITPLSGVTITRVEIVRSSSTSSNSGTISADNLTASNSNSTINTNVFTGSSTTAVTFKNSAQCRFTALNVTYTTSGGGSSTTYYHSTPDCGSTEPSYSVTFNANGHGTAPDTQTVESGHKATEPTAPTATGYTFGGWYKESGCMNKFDFNTPITDDIPLFAKWTPITYTVSFDNNGGTGTMANQTFTYNQAQTLTANTFTRTGYTFNGWNTKSDGSGDSYANSQSVKNLASTNGATITLYAQWKIQTFTVTFNSNGGTSTMTSQTFTYNQAQTLTANTFTRTGYTFNGWNTQANGQGTTYTDQQSVTLTTAGLTLYAQWKANTYTVAFNANGGTGSMSNQSFTYDQSQSLTANAFTRTNYAFKNWNTKADGSGTNYTDKQSVSNLTTTNDETVTLYAQWTKVHTITWNVAGDESNTTTVLDGEKVVLPSDPKSCSDVYTTFVGWYTEPAGGESNPSAAPLGTQITATTEPDGDKTYYAVWADGSSEGGEELKTTLDFSSNENWKIPSGSSNKTVTENQYSNGTYTIKLAGSTNYGYYYNSNQVLLGKNGAYLELPAFSFKVSKIVSTTPTATVSGSVTWNVFTGETPVSSPLTGCTSGGTFEIDKDYQTEGTIYTIKVTNANNLQIKKLEIYGPIAGATGYISTCCANSINITKGAEENGTFDVTPLGKTASCDGVTVTVTPQPANHYHVLSVTATNPSTAGSAQVVDNGDGTWNVTYEENSKGDTKIDVTFEEDTKYDVTWYVNGIALTGVELGEASTKVYENDKVEKIPDNPAPPCGGVFVGWTVAEMDVDDTDEPNELYTQQSEFPNATGNQEFYAVFADYDEQQ